MDTSDAATDATEVTIAGGSPTNAPSSEMPATAIPDDPQPEMDSQADAEPAAPSQTDSVQPEAAAMDTTPAAPDPLAAQLEQLASMGFSNEAMSRQALEAAGGDIMLAIEFLTASM